MSRIRILSEQLANQIAAGEVVERPASVVKELVENSLDAGASSIELQVEGGGSRLIRVVDNGCGMDGDDVLLCLERHATSKLRDEAGLATIGTLGFRGEALPAIGSVSRLTILSRPATQELGTQAEMRFGTLVRVHEQGCQRGTCVEVRHLFGNMPARRKFLKSQRTERLHIEEVIRNQALAHPEVGFSLYHAGKPILRYGPADFEERLRAVFGYAEDLLDLGTAAALDDYRVDGFLLLPEKVIGRHNRLRILVNGRPVQDTLIRYGVLEGLRGFLLKGHQPAGCLRVTVPPMEVDVNVHPGKREVRFKASGRVRQLVVQAVQGALADYQDRQRTHLFAGTAQEYQLESVPGSPGTVAEETPSSSSSPRRQSVLGGRQTAAYGENGGGVVGPSLPDDNPEADREPLRIIGQIFDLYLLCERPGELVIVDQHAAHERLLFNRLVSGYREKAVPRQQLLFPVTLELLPWEEEVLTARQDELQTMGFTLEPFGGSTWRISAVPALARRVEPRVLFREILQGLRAYEASKKTTLPETLAALLASMACKAAIKGGLELSAEEMKQLLASMEGSSSFTHCPHGRPVLKSFSRGEVKKWFRRT